MGKKKSPVRALQFPSADAVRGKPTNLSIKVLIYLFEINHTVYPYITWHVIPKHIRHFRYQMPKITYCFLNDVDYCPYKEKETIKTVSTLQINTSAKVLFSMILQ